ncbi:MAG: AraC family transcriptional regulator ligand-binding domain-containing protein [Mycobacteriaceae bacterium]
MQPPQGESWDLLRTTAASRHLINVAKSHGLCAEECLTGVMIPESMIHDPRYEIRAEDELSILRNIQKKLGTEVSVGKEAGQLYNITDTGALGYGILSAETVRVALDFFCNYSSLGLWFFNPQISEVPGGCILCFEDTGTPIDVRSNVFERDTAAFFRIVKFILSSISLENQIEVRTSLSNLPSELFEIEYLNISVLKSLGKNTFHIPEVFLASSMPSPDRTVFRLHEDYCEKLLRNRRKNNSTTRAVRRILIEKSQEKPSLQSISKELSLTSRTLHRRLLSEGTNFSSIVEDTFSQLADSLLESGHTVNETARKLGYSEAASFTHAYTKWKGHSPKFYQKKSSHFDKH